MRYEWLDFINSLYLIAFNRQRCIMRCAQNRHDWRKNMHFGDLHIFDRQCGNGHGQACQTGSAGLVMLSADVVALGLACHLDGKAGNEAIEIPRRVGSQHSEEHPAGSSGKSQTASVGPSTKTSRQIGRPPCRRSGATLSGNGISQNIPLFV